MQLKMLTRKKLLFIAFYLVAYQNLIGQSKPKMNVIVVVIDDIGPALLSPYAKAIKPEDLENAALDAYSIRYKTKVDVQKHLETAKKSMPFLDSMSAQAIVFNRAFATSSICAPSRAGLLTSKYQETWGAYNLEDMASTGIPLKETILAELFQKNGYTSAVIGKWHVGLNDRRGDNSLDMPHRRTSCVAEYHPLRRGFDYYYGYNASASKYYNGNDLWEGFSPAALRPETEFLTDHLNEKANEFIKSSVEKNRPFFMYYAPMTIHGALKAPPLKYMAKFSSGIQFTDIVAAHLLALDEGLRNIFETLKKNNQDKNTLLVICADNGAANATMPYSAPFKGGKGSGLLGGSRVPLIMILPGTTKYLKVDANVSNMDIMPTALDLAGIKIPANLDGVSLKNILLKRDLTFKPHDYLFSSGSHAISWSLNYMDGVTPIEQTAEKDRKFCPNFLWGIHDNNVFFNLSPIKKGLYESLPDGLPEQKFFYDLNADLKQNINLYKMQGAVQKNLEMKTLEWLGLRKEPAVYNKEAYKTLVDRN